MTQLTPIEELRYAMKQTTDKRLFERYQAVYLHFNGQTNRQIAEIIQRSRVTVGSYIHAYKKGGLVGLRMGISSGKPSYLSEEQRKALGMMITEKIPSDVGFAPYTNWTLALLVAWVEREWSITYSLRACLNYWSEWILVIHVLPIHWQKQIQKNKSTSQKKRFPH